MQSRAHATCNSLYELFGFILLAAALVALTSQQGYGQTSDSSPGTSAYESHSSIEEHAHSDALHHYSSPADEANDALLITEVKVALADDDATAGHPVLVDCDHGTVSLTGVVASQDDAKHLVQVAANQPGVKSVKSSLTW